MKPPTFRPGAPALITGPDGHYYPGTVVRPANHAGQTGYIVDRTNSEPAFIPATRLDRPNGAIR